GSGDTDALALPAREVCGQAVDQRRVQSDTRKKIENALVAIGRSADTEAIERFPNAAADRPARIEAAVRVLEPRLHATAKLRERRAAQSYDIDAVEGDGAAIRIGKAEDAAPER